MVLLLNIARDHIHSDWCYWLTYKVWLVSLLFFIVPHICGTLIGIICQFVSKIQFLEGKLLLTRVVLFKSLLYFSLTCMTSSHCLKKSQIFLCSYIQPRSKRKIFHTTWKNLVVSHIPIIKKRIFTFKKILIHHFTMQSRTYSLSSQWMIYELPLSSI